MYLNRRNRRKLDRLNRFRKKISNPYKQQLIDLTIRGGWVGIGVLLFVWLTVRIIGPSLGWWVPADIH